MFKINLLLPGEALAEEGVASQDDLDKYWLCTKCGDKTLYGDVHKCWVYLKEQTQERIGTDPIF